MLEKVGFVVVILAIAVVVITFLFLKRDYKKQSIVIEGQKYRKNYGRFYFGQYTANKNLIKSKEWLKQKNNGLEPKEYKKEIEYVSHLGTCLGVVSTRGL